MSNCSDSRGMRDGRSDSGPAAETAGFVPGLGGEIVCPVRVITLSADPSVLPQRGCSPLQGPCIKQLAFGLGPGWDTRHGVTWWLPGLPTSAGVSIARCSVSSCVNGPRPSAAPELAAHCCAREVRTQGGWWQGSGWRELLTACEALWGRVIRSFRRSLTHSLTPFTRVTFPERQLGPGYIQPPQTGETETQRGERR